MGSGVIETGVDKLVALVKQRGKIALSDSAKELGVSTTVIQEWTDFLEEEGIISVEYNLTKPFLVDRKLTKKEVEEKSKEFASKKDIFVRKAEVNLNFLEKQQNDLRGLKGEFDKLKSDLGIELDSVKDELKELEKFQHLKEDLQKQLEEQRTEAKIKIGEFTSQLARDQRKYHEWVSDLKKEKEQLVKEKTEAKSIEEGEKFLDKKLREMKSMIDLMEKKMKLEDSAIKNSEIHITQLNSNMEQIKLRVMEEKTLIEPLLEKSKEQEKKISELQSKIMEKLSKKGGNLSKSKEITKKVNDFFNKKMAVATLIDKVNKDRDDLEKSLIELIRKAKSFQLSSKKGDVGKEMSELEKKFSEVDKKKGAFQEELTKLKSFFRM
ncbi:MAG TPA: hypothetical protein VI564_04620 [Candidatus Nanoarchaeia archaeon]|nr:hypothetical protein [Candidatus Nanoarchaeia archaeon]